VATIKIDTNRDAKFEVHNLAKIKKAEIDVKDLTIFVGKNSTNKSYMAHTIYVLNKTLSTFGNSSYKEKYITKLFIKFINEHKDTLDEFKKLPTHVREKEVYLQISEDEHELEIVREVIFDFSKYDTSKLIDTIYNFIVSNILNKVNASFNANQDILKKIIFSKYDKNTLTMFKDNRVKIINHDKDNDYLIGLRKIFTTTASEFYNLKICKEEFYFPSSRTGFILAFDEIVSGVLRDRFGGQPTATKLTEPTIDFISGFADIKSGKFGDELFSKLGSYLNPEKDSNKQKMKTLFDFIETRIIKGKIIEDKKDQNYTQFYLQPTNGSNRLDLHLTSSATVELLPLVIFLKHFSKIDDRLLVIEEPEAHLHPKAQIEMARLLVMLVNAGAKVLITTHSDYILNELSNCIKLSTADEKSKKEYLKEFDLTDETTISKDRVSAYLFKDKQKEIEVIDLSIDEFGISNENFDDILDELLDRTEKINEIIG
jgi:predicted ATPase